MTLIEMIQKFGEVPYKFTYPTGESYETFIRRKTNNKGYIVSIWEMVKGIQDRMIWHADGATPEKAKENLKNKILKSAI